MQVACLVSGGVDSSVALALLKEQGHEPVAFYLKVWMEDDMLMGDCPWQEDVDYVCQVADALQVKVEIVSMQREYWESVVDYTLREVSSGRTPNPDMMCNKLIKFGAFYNKWGKDFTAIATGHYGKLISDESGRIHLHLGKDRVKDQTYFLSQMSYEQLSRCLFPLGDLTKKEVRNHAKKLKLPNADRPDSQGICFLGKINFRDFLKKYVGEKKGCIIEQRTGKVLGQHHGIWFFTIGQRNGLDLSGGPWFVIDKNPQENIVYVAHGYDPQEVYVNRIRLANFNWINPPTRSDRHTDATENYKVEVGAKDLKNLRALERIHFKIRHTPQLSEGTLREMASGEYLLLPKDKIAGVAKGQFGVIYQDEECLGGGVIS